MNISRFFIDRPVFAGVLSVLIFVSGLLALGALPISEYPEVVPPQVVVRANYPGASPKVIAETVATPIEEQINGVEGMLYMASQATTDGLMTLTVTFKLGTDPDKAQQLVQNRVAQAEPRLPDAVRALGITTHQELARPDDGRAPRLARRPLRRDLSAQLRRAERQGPPRRASTASATCSCSAPATTPCASGSTRRRWPSTGCPPSDVVAADPRAERAGRGRRDRLVAERARARACSSRSMPRDGCNRAEEFGDIVVKTGADGAVTRLRDVARHRTRRRRLRAALAARQQDRRRRRRSSRRRAPTPSRSPTTSAG